MFNADTLTQLRALKQQIQDVKLSTTGTVKGSQGRFGFVVLDDGSEVYLPAEQMQRVFPDDRVTIAVITGEDGKKSAVVETLIDSPLRDFTGFYVVRDNAHFVEPDLPRLSRWIFLPPKQRLPVKPSATDGKRAPQHGDLVRARITRHPLADGKPAARIESIIGAPDSPKIAARYALARFNLKETELTCNEQDLLQPNLANRRDLTALPLITIDNSDTQDMDDALHAEPQGDGWRLTVAIADPTAWIKPGSALEQAIAVRSNTVYLPDLTVAMLPETLANERCSLRPGEERLALVCTIDIDAHGAITHSEFCEARVRSQAKLSYSDAAALLQEEVTEAGVESSLRTPLLTLAAAAGALRQQRQRDHLLMPDRPDYRLQFDEKGNVSGIECQPKTPAHHLIEECMVAANRCAADFLADDAALFVVHNGFRSERSEQIATLIAAELPEKSANDVTRLADYIDLIQTLDLATPSDTVTEASIEAAIEAPGKTTPLPVRAVLSRWLTRSQLSTTAAPHFGMGLTRYTTFTSPIRKFSDFFVHRAIKARLQGKKLAALSPQQLAHVQLQTDHSRQAAHLAEQWLKCAYLQQQPADTVYQGTIAHINSSGYTVRLDNTGIEGFVDTRLLPEKYSFDAATLRLNTGAKTYQLEQAIAVRVTTIDLRKRSINFEEVTPDSATAAEPIESSDQSAEQRSDQHSDQAGSEA